MNCCADVQHCLAPIITSVCVLPLTGNAGKLSCRWKHNNKQDAEQPGFTASHSTKRRGRSRKRHEAQVTGSKLHAGEAKCKRMRDYWDMVRRRGWVKRENQMTVSGFVLKLSRNTTRMRELRQTIASLCCRAWCGSRNVNPNNWDLKKSS